MLWRFDYPIQKSLSSTIYTKLDELTLDKAYAHEEAKRDLGFTPRTLEAGLQQEIELMRYQGII